jgi:signal transduction histidine kinase/ActR/RegA family two-component response regulator
MPGTRFFWDSIRWRAALLTSALVAVVLAAFTWYAVARVEADLLQRGGERAEAAAAILADQTAQATQQGLARLREAAGQATVRAAFLSPNDQTTAEAIANVHSAVVPTQEQTIALWDARGHLIAEAAFPPQAATVMPQASAPTAAGLEPLQTHGDVLFTRTVTEVPGESVQGQPARLGFLVTSHVVHASASSTLVNGMVGNGATVLIGNQSGAVWTDLGTIVPAPLIDLRRTGAREFRAANGEGQIGALANIAGTPWVLVIAFPRSIIVAPAWQLLKRLAAAGAAFMLMTMLAAGALSGRVTEPLDDLNLAAQAIESGDYSRRVVASRRDEVGQLAYAFNAMAEQVERGRVALEIRAAELADSHEVAREANHAKDQFLAMLSHELRTPLSAMLGWCRMLREGTVPVDGTGHALRVIERNAVAQLRLVEDLLDVSRIVAGKFSVEMQCVDPVTIVHAAIESIQPVADAKGIVVSVDVQAGAGIGRSVHGDPGRLQQAVGNLLSNAIKFTPRGGSVYVSVSHVGASVEIVVRDTGEGISAGTLPRVFERLQQGESGMARRHAGLGLGLAIVRQVVELHHGTVSAESGGRGQGATFRMSLPMSTAPTPTAGAPTDAPPIVVSDASRPARVPSVRGVRVLLVDDADDDRELLSKSLSGHGAVVIPVPTAETALRWLEENRPDVIISDVEMPSQDGLAMMRTIRSRPAAAVRFTPAIAITANTAPEDQDRSLASGFQVHLVKPVDLADLLTTVASLAASPSHRIAVAPNSSTAPAGR